MRPDLLLRMALPVVALIALAVEAPQVLTGVLALVALALAADRLTALRGNGPVDRVLVGVGGGLVVVVLTGMVLGSTSLGLSPTTWVIALSGLSLAGLLLAAVLPARAPDLDAAPEPLPGTSTVDRRKALVMVPWLAAVAVVVVVSVQMTGASLSAADAEPVQMSLGEVSGTEIDVVVSSSEPVGPLEVRTSNRDNQISYPLFDVAADGSVTTTVSVPESGRFVITLGYPDQIEPLRTLVVDR